MLHDAFQKQRNELLISMSFEKITDIFNINIFEFANGC
jgi:hypothetical protein